MTATRPRDLVVAFVAAVVVGNLLVRLSYGSLPGFPAPAGATLAVLGIAEAVAGWVLKGRVDRRPGSKPVEPLVAARAVLVAKASALGGALVGGLWTGLLLYTVPRASEVTAAAADTLAGAVGLVSALLLVGGALWLEHCCRAPSDHDDTHRGRGTA
ncbi:DUF3180 domain-containing protein [Pseudonocardia oroxyli]|uniref:DUF3180 domain-containing protein n=1 Tax=Pseudonocardia oroxyli TaxID=366584 RepID=A0A1G7PFK7_PSEOR|nr:DUF3180 domain-containing protein [Pseudonocardia oroxyli]SDF85045.1 Protein of unknown function [Pseudonocardia oroxyli]